MSTHHAHDRTAIACGILTVSDTRSEADDTSGQRIRAALDAAGHRVAFYRIVKDEPAQIAAAIDAAPPEVEVIITNGGTGVARRDTTYEAITRLLDKEITGFGELFRMLSWEQVGAAAMLSRATAGIAGRRVIFSLPGSSKAVELAMEKLIVPQLGHVVGLVRS
ncbi:MAG: molybdenum cofactor biosynthesis protein B [Deltaproteobacteria bacterium]|nr:molybdenum cofactor biosynthesis protein B [Deltaproteobacteria bacterium]